MRNEAKVVVLAAGLTLIMIISLVVRPPEHVEHERFLGFETIYGVLGTLWFGITAWLLSRINTKEGLWDD